jgi:hypothetical protein
VTEPSLARLAVPPSLTEPGSAWLVSSPRPSYLTVLESGKRMCRTWLPQCVGRGKNNLAGMKKLALTTFREFLSSCPM